MQQADIHAPGRPPAAQGQAASLRAPKRATQLSLFIAGFALSSWAPLVPFAQQRLGADAATLGSVLLCLGLGAVIGMPGAGRVGCKALIVTAGLLLAAVLPLMAIASTAFTLGLCLLIFGAATGAIDVAANVHGTEVQRIARQPLMSGFHGLYSIGGLVGAAAMTAIIAAGATAAAATIAASLVIALCVLLAAPGFLTLPQAKKAPLLIVPRGIVVGIGLLAMVIFLAEGAMLDWGALLLSREKGVDQRFAGAGYSVFACAMTLIRFVGDRFVARVGERVVLIAGFLITAGGLALAAWSSNLAVVYPAIAFAGLAAGNVVPILFSLAGRQTAMPPSQAIAAASMLGYLGVLLGPAVLGYAAHAVGLVDAFLWLAGLVAVSAVAIRLVVRR
ncbi:MFS transporter [Achromobacter animicus]|uniref:MFS transporter n=1 Tax=Achromobacter animicus TaxID=1389935 RepID=UPI0028B016EC|nr:MFS transporter [Achromobacter animicus]